MSKALGTASAIGTGTLAVFHKEFRSLLRERRGWLIPVVYVLVLGAVAGLFLTVASRSHGRVDDELGQMLAGVVAVVQTLALVIFAPLVGAGSIAGEREQGTFSVLLSAPVHRYAVGLGKASVAVLYCFVLLSASLPVAAMALLFGGPDIEALAGLYFTHAILGGTMTLMGLAVSTLFRKTWTAAFVAVGVTVALSIVTLALGALDMRIEHWDNHGPPWVLYFNPGFSLPLFFDGDGDWVSAGMWWSHYAALASMGLASLVYVLVRLKRARD